ncbi:hypothetical protein BpHYR1_049098 [Brachionus plicatilis]|uniref:Uncharacterized protein n=1 Tax=Brachionus plicatilis TaxID=10195 RepID=A0A3M7T2I2_BRAPC|nr:hypothetical protein BpHYR1_049098 [Brachionus plicatilis]
MKFVQQQMVFTINFQYLKTTSLKYNKILYLYKEAVIVGCLCAPLLGDSSLPQHLCFYYYETVLSVLDDVENIKMSFILIKLDDVHVERDRAYTRSLHTEMCLC